MVGCVNRLKQIKLKSDKVSVALDCIPLHLVAKSYLYSRFKHLIRIICGPVMLSC